MFEIMQMEVVCLKFKQEQLTQLILIFLFSVQYISTMGSSCEKCLEMFQQKEKVLPLPKKTTRRQQDIQTNRQIMTAAVNLPLNQTVDKNKNTTNDSKTPSRDSQCNSSYRDTKVFSKNRSTALFTQIDSRRNSTISQFTLDHESIIILKNPAAQSQKEDLQHFYTLIDKKAYVKRTGDRIQISTPNQKCEVNCPPQYLFSTLTIMNGQSIQGIDQVAPKKYIQVQQSPLHIILILQCKLPACKKKTKITLSKGFIDLQTVFCSKCQNSNSWKIKSIKANVPVWGNGEKIQPDEVQALTQTPRFIRALGCIYCFRVNNCEKFRCGCFLCKFCKSAQEISDLSIDCKFCQSDSFIV